MAVRLEDMSVDDVCDWLEDNGYPETAQQSFREQEMDGNAINFGLASAPGPDWLKDVVPTLGLRLKVHNSLRALCSTNQPVSRGPSPGINSPPNTDTASVPSGFLKSPTGSTVSITDSGSDRGKCSTSTPTRRVDTLPNPFPIPKFRQCTEANLENQILTDSDRKYIVQTLATVLMTHVQRPSLKQCGTVAKALVQKHTYLKDDEGDGEHSWKWFLYYRCQNVNRQSKNDGGNSRKRPKLDDHVAHLCPPTHAEDDVSFGRNVELLHVEVGKPKPRVEVVRDLMRRTFPNRWDAYVNNNEPSTLLEYLSRYPLLKKAAFASQEFALVCKDEMIRDSFEEKLPLWAKAVVMYCKDTQIRSSSLQTETAEYVDTIDDDLCIMMALRCLSLLFTTTKTKKLEQNIPYILNIVQRGTPPSEAGEQGNNQPHIILFASDDDDMTQQFFICVEQNLMIESSNVTAAIFFCIAAHYIFNLTYHRKAADVWMFLQEKVLGLPSKTGVRRNPSTTSHFSGISRIFDSITAEN